MIHSITDFQPYVCTPTTPVREALRRLNRTDYLFQVVVDPHSGRCVGTLTDGDVRRALLEGLQLDGPVEACMFATFKLGTIGDAEHNERLLLDPVRPIRFLPLATVDGSLAGIAVRTSVTTEIQTAMVMAGGFGQRLGELTRDTPKPLLTVGDRPILAHVLERLENAGIERIIISLHYLSDQIRAFVQTRESRARIEFVEEEEPLGTAGAIGLLTEELKHPILVVNGDVITSADYPALHEFHTRHALDATIGVTPYEVDVPFGVVRMGANGLLVDIEEKPRLTEFVAAGIYYLTPAMIALVARGRRLDMPELLRRGTELGLRIGAFPIHEYWVDVGRKTDLQRAHDDHAV